MHNSKCGSNTDVWILRVDSLGKIQLKNASHPAVDCSKMATQTNKIEVTMEEAEGAQS